MTAVHLVAGWFDVEVLANRSPICQAPKAEDGRTRLTSASLELEFSTGDADAAYTDRQLVLVLGQPRLDGTQTAANRVPAARSALAEIAAGRWQLPTSMRGRYAVMAFDSVQSRALLAVDRFGVLPIYYARHGSRVYFSDRADALAAEARQDISTQSLFHYYYFHCIPAPRSVFAGVERLRAGEQVSVSPAGLRRELHWVPAFDEHTDESLGELEAKFRSLLAMSVSRHAADGGTIGTFLSGGTDSSTITGLLSQTAGARTKAFSVGFAVDGYDEMQFARIAARQFGVDHHEVYLSPDDVAAAIPRVATYYDQPFGNSSALPAYLCAWAARAAGVDKLLAGDGGDELFGGNTRYAKQKVFAAYDSVPFFLRNSLIEPALLGNGIATRLPLVKKLSSYVIQAKIPLPARLQTYNLLDRIGRANIFERRFLDQIRDTLPAQEESEAFARSAGASLTNRLLAFDWQYTLADSDLPKVLGTCALAGMDVAFPMLDDELLDFSLRLPSNQKVRGLRLRHFFKRSLRDLLPAEILKKRKHGFGLPFGVWLGQNAALQKLARDAIDGLSWRGLLSARHVDDIGRKLEVHPGYFGELIWLHIALEEWLRSRAPAFRV